MDDFYSEMFRTRKENKSIVRMVHTINSSAAEELSFVPEGLKLVPEEIMPLRQALAHR